ncbi:MAG: HD domain-containing protein [Clostridia bacterium]|jgi:HD superfamily phosphohydrolase|nr:HD domain-containing protein [Clostridia bacterium]
MSLRFYLEQLHYKELPDFLIKYLQTPSLLRLKKVGYFCGMDYASKDIYDFSEYISRYDHSLTVSLLVYKLTKNKIVTLAGLFHDVATPCFSHVIDYMNKDYEKQESTEKYTERILRSDEYLKMCLQEDNIEMDDIVDFKKYTIVDNERPKVCADRIDGVILTGIGWTKNINNEDIKQIVDDLCIYRNEDNEEEIGFKKQSVVAKVLEVSKSIDIYCHSKEDNYMMELLAEITKLSIDKRYISYEELYLYQEEEIFSLWKEKKDKKLLELIQKFENIKKSDISIVNLPNIKIRDLKPIVNGKRVK